VPETFAWVLRVHPVGVSVTSTACAQFVTGVCEGDGANALVATHDDRRGRQCAIAGRRAPAPG